METGLAGKSVIVTGGGSNVGRGIVLAFAKEGSKIAIADIDEPQGQKVCSKAIELGARAALTIKTDVTSQAEVGRMVRRVLEKFARIDVLVNNVGWHGDGSFIEQVADLDEKQINLNLRSTIYCTRAVLPHMIEQGSGRVVNIGSESGRAGDPERTVYSACKGAVISLTKALARDVGCYGITVNCVSPHAIIPDDPEEGIGQVSQFYSSDGNISQRLASSEIQSKITRGHALKRVGRPADVGAAVVFLASEVAGYITGQTLSVNGGDSMI